MDGTLVLGLGNVLLGDEGAGVRVVERLLARYDLPEGVRAMDGGTLGLDLLPYLEGVERLVVVDAVQAQQAPGTLVRLRGREIPVFLDAAKVSPHQDGLHDLLAAAMLKGCLPGEVVLWGVQVESLGVGLDLGPAVAARVDELVQKVVEELARWGVTVREAGEAVQAASPARVQGSLRSALTT
jgi:hydrogenase maturation protease